MILDVNVGKSSGSPNRQTQIPNHANIKPLLWPTVLNSIAALPRDLLIYQKIDEDRANRTKQYANANAQESEPIPRNSEAVLAHEDKGVGLKEREQHTGVPKSKPFRASTMAGVLVWEVE